MSIEISEINKRVSEVPWFHWIELGNGIITTGVDNSPEKLKTITMPPDLTGMSVLAIGARDGFFSFEAERRNAKSVLATDSFIWEEKGWGSKDGFVLARTILNSRVDDKTIDVMDLAPESIGKFDLVLFLGVLYHMKHPLLALKKVASVTEKILILETHVDLIDIDRPAAAFYPDSELGNDWSNWRGPNPVAVAGMLKTVGFAKIYMANLCVTTNNQKRAVYHVWK